MAIPKMAQKQAEEAERLHKEMYPDPKPVETPKEEAPKEEPKLEGESLEVEKPAQNLDKPDDKKDEAEPNQEPKAQEKPSEDFEQKYKVIQGKYENEVPRLQATVKQLESAIAQQTTQYQIEQQRLQAELSAAKNKSDPIKTEVERSELLTPEEVEEYGPDFVDVMRRAGKEAAQPLVKQLLNKVETLENQLGQVKETVVEDQTTRVYRHMDERVNDWREINTSQEFLGWLSQPDPFSGVQRHNLLKQAFEAGEVERVEKFFTGYKAEHAAISPAANTQPEAQKPQVDMSTLVAPGSPQSGSDNRTQEPKKQTFSTAQVNQFYADVRRGTYRSNPQERSRIENAIIRAGREGRITD